MIPGPKRSRITFFKIPYFRPVVLFVLLFSLLPNVSFAWANAAPDLLNSPNADAAEFIIGPQAPVGSSWFDTVEIQKARIHGAACPDTPPTDPTALNSFVLLQYYDLPLTEYVVYSRTGDPAFLAYAQKCADVWWKHPDWIREGMQRDFDNGRTPPPRHGGIGGLILRALDGRPEMWDWINKYTRFHFDLWVKRRVNDPQLYYGVREGAFALHYATWLAKVLPDSFPLQAGGTEINGAGLRAQYLADVEAVSMNYYGRLQKADGSWRWDDVDFVDSDGGTLKGIMQPFMIGLLLNALVDVHRLSTNSTVKINIQNQIANACRHLYQDGPYRKDEAVVGLTGKRWRSFWYFYHGGTTVNPTRYQYGGGSYTNADQNWIVKSERQGISTIFSAYGYVYMITGDPTFKTMGDELFESAFGDSTDGIRNEADGTAKNYNQNYRMGGRYLIWSQGGGSGTNPTPTPTPSPSSSPTPTPTPTATPTPTPTPTPSPSPTPTPTPTPAPTPTPSPAATVKFVKVDTTTKGSWKSVYGGDGYNTIGDVIKYPNFVQVNVTGSNSSTWSASTSDMRALQKTNTTDRVAARWDSNSFFTMDLNFTDGQSHRVAIYCLDWDGNNRQQRVDVVDWATNTLIESRSISQFNGGQYLVWDIRGRVKLVVAKTGAKTAVISGIYFGGAAPTPTPTPTPSPTPTPAPSAPQVVLTVPSNGATFVAGNDITLAANATDSNGVVTKVDFYRSGTLIGTDTTAPYSVLWSNVPKGVYELTAKATDDSGLSATSAPVSITVTNSPNAVNKAKGRADSLIQNTGEYAGAADSHDENTALANDIGALAFDIEQAYAEFLGETNSFGGVSPAIDNQIRAAVLFAKAGKGLALKAASSTNIKNNLLRIASHLAIAEDLMRYGTVSTATATQANTTKARMNIVVGDASTGYGMSAVSSVAPSSLGAIAGAGNVQPMITQTLFASLLADGTLPYEVGGLSVTVGGVAVPVLYASPWGIKFFMPADMPLGATEV
ncbi:MAG TPA: Ig-like domain-containing protein, partial [Pyrinomonadaceae bacterium]|nr:Ig-like domain-containing protein [Pyrinomonadaceae bacterium]